MNTLFEVWSQQCWVQGENPMSSPMPHAPFGCSLSHGMESDTAQLLATLAPQRQCSWQKEKLNQPQLLRLLNSTTGQEGDTSVPEASQRMLGNTPFPMGPHAAATQPCPKLAAQHSRASFRSDGATSYLMLLAALAHKSRFGLKWEKSFPLSMDVNGGLDLQEL